MIKTIFRKVFGTENERFVKKLWPVVHAINAREEQYRSMSDEALRACTQTFREQLSAGRTVDDLLVDAFAVVREAGRRVLNMRHFDVQLLGGMVLHHGSIAEMKTGEGKTLVATLPAYLNALPGKGVHVVTVNDYLARRDSQWMGKIFEFLGMTVGVIQHDMDDLSRRQAYGSDITYGTNNEFGFDYLRDNMKFEVESLVQREFHYAIVDEVDSILIDEARTPLIISGPTSESTAFYYRVNDFVSRIVRDETHFEKDEKSKTVVLTEQGIAAAEAFFQVDNLYDLTNMDMLHQVNQSLRAHCLFARDKDYLVKDGQVVIVDEFTGRMMTGRRYSDGLHQALEAKENVKIEQEYQTLAQITFQNYFRMYRKLSGMTGTAATEAEEFRSIYGLSVVEIPTNRPMIRKEHPDVIYGSTEEKWDAVVEEIRQAHERRQPTLVGTISIENSEYLSRRLKQAKIPHVVLNAKYHETEADIVAQAGRPGAVTIATNMAGRGTDILLGGNPDFMLRETLRRQGTTEEGVSAQRLEELRAQVDEETRQGHDEVISLGGLYILGTERHESRRIDNQLRGRSGRQGDPGCSRFFISLEDDLMKILGSDRVKGLLVRAGMTGGVPIENRLVSRAIENAQKQIESQNFSIRKHLLEYDDVMNRQRQVIYNLRREILGGKDLLEDIVHMASELVEDAVHAFLNPEVDSDLWDFDALHNQVLAQFGLDIRGVLPNGIAGIKYGEIVARIQEMVARYYREKCDRLGAEQMRHLERMIMLQVLDTQWKDHLKTIDHLKEGIGLRGYAQQNPLIEYKKESFALFEALRHRMDEETIRFLYLFEPVGEQEMDQWQKRREKAAQKPSNRPVSRIPGGGKKKRRLA